MTMTSTDTITAPTTTATPAIGTPCNLIRKRYARDEPGSANGRFLMEVEAGVVVALRRPSPSSPPLGDLLIFQADGRTRLEPGIRFSAEPADGFATVLATPAR
jgi:hypothetical protein